MPVQELEARNLYWRSGPPARTGGLSRWQRFGAPIKLVGDRLIYLLLKSSKPRIVHGKSKGKLHGKVTQRLLTSVQLGRKPLQPLSGIVSALGSLQCRAV